MYACVCNCIECVKINNEELVFLVFIILDPVDIMTSTVDTEIPSVVHY